MCSGNIVGERERDRSNPAKADLHRVHSFFANVHKADLIWLDLLWKRGGTSSQLGPENVVCSNLSGKGIHPRFRLLSATVSMTADILCNVGKAGVIIIRAANAQLSSKVVVVFVFGEGVALCSINRSQCVLLGNR